MPIEVIQWGQVSAARQVGGGKQTRQVSGTAKTNPDAAQAPPLRSELETRGRLAYHLLGLHGNVPISRPVTNLLFHRVERRARSYGAFVAEPVSSQSRRTRRSGKNPAMNHVVIAEAKPRPCSRKI